MTAAPHSRTNAIPMALSVKAITSVRPSSGSGTRIAVRVEASAVSIARETTPGIRKVAAEARVQSAGIDYEWRPVTADQAVNLAAVRRCHAPLTIVNVARQLGWPEQRARYWLETFEAKGALVRIGRVLTWRCA